MSFGLHWFRRDLRVAGNPALNANFTKNQGRVLGIFFFDAKFLAREDFSHNRFGFFLRTLVELQKEMRELGGDLLVLDSEPGPGFKKLLEKVKPTNVSFNRDYEPFARARDTKVTQELEAAGIEVLTFADHLIFEPSEIAKPDGGTYQVFTPFSKRWLLQLDGENVAKKIASQRRGLNYLERRSRELSVEPIFKMKWNDVLPPTDFFSDQLANFVQQNAQKLTVEMPEAGSVAAYRALQVFTEKVADYERGRDFPSENATSHLSIFLKNGSITSSQVLATIPLQKKSAIFIKEIIWREFYYHILYHYPEVETSAFKPQYKDLKWENDQKLFEKWKQGLTGYPIVDAGMRQLLKTGWMHNRVRMIVASFLTKDLLIDYRWGEKWFMQELLDGDLAPNNGGWQWAASTGCDAQPYFRIFNPELQSRKFDPEGEYIRKYVPELRDLSNSEIHAPDDDIRPKNYPEPIVVHSQQKLKALKLFSKL